MSDDHHGATSGTSVPSVDDQINAEKAEEEKFKAKFPPHLQQRNALVRERLDKKGIKGKRFDSADYMVEKSQKKPLPPHLKAALQDN